MTYLCAVNHKSQKRENTKGIATLNLIVILGFVIFLAVYLIATDSLVGKNYQLRAIEGKVKEEQELAEKLKNKQTELSALYNLQQAAKDLGLVAIEKVKYLDAIDSSVALMK